MLDEPYRWIDAIHNRHEYIEDQLRGGSPVVGLKYDDGLLFLTIGRGQRKIFEVHNRIVLTAMGHAADIERLRMMATETASVEAFQNSVDDLTLHRLTNFVLGPTIKGAFEAIFGPAYIIKMLLAELGARGRENQLLSLNYDGTVRASHIAQVIGGTDEVETAMRNYLSAAEVYPQGVHPTPNLSLTSTLRLALETWGVGRELSLQEDDRRADSDSREREHFESTIDKAKVHELLKKELKEGEIEAGVLQASRQSKSKFRPLSSEEIHAAIVDWL